jgi:hypothetical protein
MSLDLAAIISNTNRLRGKPDLPRLRSLLYLLSFTLISASRSGHCSVLCIELAESVIHRVLADNYGLVHDPLLRLQIDVFDPSLAIVVAFLDQSLV